MCSESPRFLIKRGPKYYVEAYQSLLHLRGLPLLAAKELFYIDYQIKIEKRLLSKGSNDAEQHLNDQKSPKKVSQENSQALRKRKGRRSYDVDAPRQVYEDPLKPSNNEKRSQSRNCAEASEADDKQPKDAKHGSGNQRYLIWSINYWKRMWHGPLTPRNRSINYWQKIGQLLTKRRIRRVFLVVCVLLL